ncbi:Lamina-associated polypeptide 2, isoforms beta/delta/epsilon/gamma [Liparis tanakae]|uniref:Lamina-associated polypeptide 2, isoforms beta/delta/epsilon/gamma n=1 Tax=Liparis tanakae TaxID=230148 RepID=A0A4Z2I179_9TELE|nr:Lamina-associated polypeptide 2, isoforms beta/delta/epsilon/gamma [Liparis tanakae]
MAEFLEDPSVLTKEKLKNELAANDVPLPGGEHKKEVYVQLYLKNLTVLNDQKSPPVDTFSSDEELPTPVVSNRSRSGRKATKKTDKPRLEEVEVTDLTDEDLKQQLEKHGVDTGPIVATTRKLYEKKLQKLLDQPPAEPEAPTDVTALPKADSNQNGNNNSDQYSDKEDEEIAVPEPEPVPVVERSVRSRGKIPVTFRTSSSSRRQIKVVEEIITEETPQKASESVVEDILANEINTPTSMSATCRRPIRGAAGRPLKTSEYWLDESRLQHSVHTETRAYSESFSRASSSVSSSKAPAQQGFLSMLFKLLLLVVVGGSLFYAYQNLDAGCVDTLKGLLDSVIVPLQGVANNAATYLGISSSGAAKSAGK